MHFTSWSIAFSGGTNIEEGWSTLEKESFRSANTVCNDRTGDDDVDEAKGATQAIAIVKGRRSTIARWLGGSSSKGDENARMNDGRDVILTSNFCARDSAVVFNPLKTATKAAVFGSLKHQDLEFMCK
jgi:hypothetical protein